MKRIVSFLLVFVLLMTFIPISMITASAGVGDNVLYERESNNYRSSADRIYNDYTVNGSVYNIDVDYFEFVLSSEAKIQLVCASSHSTIYFGIENSSGTAIYAMQPSTITGSSYTCSKIMTLSAGTYYIGVLSSVQSSTTKTYSMYFEYTNVTSSHTHSYSNACDTTCNGCGGVRSVSGHQYDGCTDAYCNECSASRKTSGHQYTNSCDSACNKCSYTRNTSHKYTNACDTNCNVCGSSRTAGAHVYSFVCDNSCNICNAKRKVTHTYKKVATKKASLLREGTQKAKCSVCGYTASKTTTIPRISSVVLSSTSYIYNGKVKTPNVTVKDTAGKKLKKGTDYVLSYSSGRVKAGTYKVKVTFKGNYSGSRTLTFKITPQKASNCAAKLSVTRYVYNGTVRNPKLTIKSPTGATLKKGVDYTVHYATTRKGVGTHKITVKMKGNYKGTKTLSFKIVPTTKTSALLAIGRKNSIGAKSHTSIKYTSSNKKVATVDSKGIITAVSAGKATISVTSNKITQKITVSVKKPYVSVKGQTNAVMLKNKTTLTATTNTGSKITWSSSDKSIATVSSSGVVTGQKAGTAKIYAKVNFKGKTYTSTYSITVNRPYLQYTSATLDRGNTYNLSVVGGSGWISYSSSDTSVATVSSNGVIKAVQKGSCTITATRNGYSMTFNVYVNGYPQRVLYNDSNVTISLKDIEKSQYDDDRIVIKFTVKNKSYKNLLIQADAISLNGYSFCDLIMSDEVGAWATGTIELDVENFDFNLVDMNAITQIGGQLRIINDDNWSDSYDANFNNVKLDGSGTGGKPSNFSYSNLLYSDSRCAIYYRSIRRSEYDDSEAEIELYVDNKSDQTLEIQADTITVNGYSYSDVIMSDPVLTNSIGIVNLTVEDFNFYTVNMNGSFTLGGQLRVFNEKTFSDTTKASFYGKSVN